MAENRHSRRMNERQSGRDHAGFCPRANPLHVLIALLALAIQLFVVQTHIHNGSGSAIAAPSGLTTGSEAPTYPDGFPVKDDPSNCPLCQEFAHAGVLLHAAQIPGWVPVFTVERPPRLTQPVQAASHNSHSWFGRAPPAPTIVI